jgi:Cys-rich protein (TIGR01571 family)
MATKKQQTSTSASTSSEKTPLLPPSGRGGALQKSQLPDYEIPFWQNQPMWSTGLFDCCADVPMCCFTIFFPCFAFGRNAEALDGGKNSCWTAAAVWWALQHTIALGCLYSSSFRGRLRAKYNIPEGPVPDSVVHCLCWPCAFCQEHREIHYRSFGPEFWGTQTITSAPLQQHFVHTKPRY